MYCVIVHHSEVLHGWLAHSSPRAMMLPTHVITLTLFLHRFFQRIVIIATSTLSPGDVELTAV
jgi:hypothetical protein